MFAELNQAQAEAAGIVEGPVLVIAGAGTGKTRTLIHRLVRLVNTGISPQSILLLTFTRRAAQEMINITSCDFKEFAAYMCKNYGEAAFNDGFKTIKTH